MTKARKAKPVITMQAPVKAMAHPLFAVIASMPNTCQPPEGFADNASNENILYDHNHPELSTPEIICLITWDISH
jgi:hypothetical protein